MRKNTVSKNNGQIFLMYMDVVLYATHATQPFTSRDLSLYVIQGNEKVAYHCVAYLIELGYLEAVGRGIYRATQYAKDIMNVERKIVV
ncbi:hypothetical protein [Acinetobacter sp. ANC 3813]|uniref:hypothetical protein n=1 Tax=Acinetobacter sp. ANC 3813 TaxID=1977873 RepID=UPI000A33AD0F|nr:hypothetical protein [Acinetobacter sp. ANC 3813]OTG87904.1 hypothetical protein B9T34_16350 [Acinetobacter sp. ANC 3813]